MTSYGKTLKQIRINKGLTQKDVAENIISHSFYAKVERDDSNIAADRLLDILDRLNMEGDEFLFIHNGYNEPYKRTLRQDLLQTFFKNDTEKMTQLRAEIDLKFRETDDFFYQLLSIDTYCIIQKLNDEPIDVALIEPLKNYLFDTETWGHYEAMLFTNNMFIFDIETNLMFANKLLKNLKQYEQYSLHERHILTALINLTILCIDNDYTHETDYYLKLLSTRKKNPKFLYERNITLFLNGICLIRDDQVTEGRAKSERAIQILNTLNMTNNAKRYQKYLDNYLNR
ncbi:helix-turn-helix domain-containing protein [Listeria cornellensis]|uniref:HTH cro/C1-type domain-containing protein n=1 Tax=Listeria cornellensis FSL F6-0969 TaxID=1265820 RepID=W7C1B9_9LIST|nr:Rgg/GadR/MutR family transcriptional regulator [Listeria cornellensis]EUJ26328.1 hypothetical protein PCORN_15126 [Listeria cornellensis FSL F6-0969]